MLVCNTHFGSSLASNFSSSISPTSQKQHDHPVVLMANHGFTVVGSSIKQAVYRAVYTKINASVQTQALMIRSAALSISKSGGEDVEEMRFLDKEEETEGCLKMNDASQDRPWGLWVKEVKKSGLYELGEDE